MIRRLLVVLVVLAATVVLATPASAAGATSQTFNFHGPFTMTVGALCNAPAGTLSGTENVVMHTTVNAAGDFWLTTTQEASFSFVPAIAGNPTYAGHLTVWFGVSANSPTQGVLHDNFNITARGSDGSTLNIHLVDHVSVSASGQVNSFSTTCG